jgi:hypothetical protein
MAFSLSPGVSVREYNLTGYVPNVPSARTGMVLRSNQGPCLDVTSITNENDLVSVFGTPNSTNYQDWFQAWNFLQYASSLYISRPMNVDVTNAGITLTGETSDTDYKTNLYNPRKAETTLENMGTPTAPLSLYKKDVTSDQRDAVAVCSKPATYTKPIAVEFYANLSVSANESNTVTASENTLIRGSQVLLNGNKLATVESIVSNNTMSAITFNTPISASDISNFYMTALTSAVSFTGSAGPVWYLTVDRNNFNAKIGVEFELGGTFPTNSFFISGIANDTSSTYKIYLTQVRGTNVPPTFDVNTILTSSTLFYQGTVSSTSTTGDTIINLQSGFILESGQTISFFIENLEVGSYNIIAVDTLNNQVTLSNPLTISVPAGTTLFGEYGYKIVTETNTLIGVNFFDQKYDDSVIVKTKKTVTLPDNTSKTMFIQSLVSFNKLFQYPPNWTNNEFALVLLVKDRITTLYKLNKTYILSYDSLAKNKFGANIFAEKVLFDDGTSPVYAKIGDITQERPNTSNIPLPKFVNDINGTNVYPKSLTNSNLYDGNNYTQGDIQFGQDLFADPETFDINILISNEKDANGMSTIAETRKDCVAIVIPFEYSYLSTNAANACTEYLLDNFGTQTESEDKIFSTFGTYSAIYGNMKYQYDKYNDLNRWINIGGDIAGLYAQTDANNDTWWAPAGSTRGVIKNCIKIAFNPNKQNRDDLYINGINPIMAIAGEGNAVVWGQKTATTIPSAMDRVNVRRLLIYLEKAIASASRLGLFEFNDTFTRNRLFGIIDPFLRSVKTKRGLYDYKLVVDDTNNNSQVIDANGLVIDIYLQPTKVAEFINLNMVVVPTGVSFSEVVGKY